MKSIKKIIKIMKTKTIVTILEVHQTKIQTDLLDQ